MNVTLDMLSLATDCALRASLLAERPHRMRRHVTVEIADQAARLAATGEVERRQNTEGVVMDGSTRTPEELALQARRLAKVMQEAGDAQPLTLPEPMSIDRDGASVEVRATLVDAQDRAHLWRVDTPITSVEVGAIAAAYPTIGGVKTYTVRRPDMTIANYGHVDQSVWESHVKAAALALEAMSSEIPPENPRSRSCRSGSCPGYGRFECKSTRGFPRRGKV